MALNFPDIIQHNNPNYAILDSTSIRGTAYTITNLSDTGSIPSDKRNTGMFVFVSNEKKFYGYFGDAVSGWNTITNWKKIADGDGALAIGAITTGSSGTNQNISGSLTVLGGIINTTASYASQSISASYATTSSYTLDGFISASVNVNTLKLFKGNGTTSSITIDTGSSITSFSDLGSAISDEFLYYYNETINSTSNLKFTDANGVVGTGSFLGKFTGKTSDTVNFVGTSSWAESASYARYATSVTSVSSSYPFSITGSTIYSANSNILSDGTISTISQENNLFIGPLSAIKTNYSNSIAIGSGSGYRENDYAGSESSSYGNIFLGRETGYSKLSTDYVKSSLFALYRAGRESSATDSIFIGRESGIKAQYSSNSVFIGVKTGALQPNASHSIFIGYKAGSTVNYPNGDDTDVTTFNSTQLRTIPKNPLGINNTIIGTNITLPSASANSINFGGVLFGSGTYSDINGYPLATPVNNGKIGINIYPKNYNLEVSGTTNITNGLYVTNSINLSGSMYTTGSLIVTGSLNLVGTASITGGLITSGTNTFYGTQSVSGSVSILNNLEVYGTASFYFFSTQYVTTSVIVATGSNSLGDTLEDIQTLIGSVIISGSLTVTGSTYLTASNITGGLPNYIVRWKDDVTLTTSSIFETGSNILIGTTQSINDNFKLQVSGNLLLNSYQISSISSSTNDNYVGIWRPSGSAGYTNFLETNRSESKHNWVFRGTDGFNIKRGWYTDNSSIVNINLGWGEPDQTFFTASTLLIDPHISKSNTNSALIRGIYYNPTISASNNLTHIAIETTTGSIIFKNLSTNSGSYVVLYDTASGELYYTASSNIGGNSTSNPSYLIYSGSVSASTNVGTGSIFQIASGSITLLYISASGNLYLPSGSLKGTASYAETASYALNGGSGAGFPYSGSAVITGSLLISGSGTGSALVLTGSINVSGSITASLYGTASYATYASSSLVLYNSSSYIQQIRISDFSNDVATTFTNGVLNFIFGTPTQPNFTNALTFNGTFDTDRFNKENDNYSITASISANIGSYQLISASLYTGSVLLTTTGSGGTLLTYALTTSGSQNYRLEVTSSSPIDGQLYYQTASISGTLAKISPTGYTSISSWGGMSNSYRTGYNTDNNQIYYIEEGATSTITFTNNYPNPSNRWTRINEISLPNLLITTSSIAQSTFTTASYSSGILNSPSYNVSIFTTFMFYKQRSIRYFYLDIGAPATFNIQNAHDLSFQFFTIGITQGIATFATDGQYKHLCFLVDYNNDPTDINDPPAIWNVTNGWTNEYSAFSKKYIDSTFVLYYTTLPVSVDNLKLAIGTKYLSQDIL